MTSKVEEVARAIDPSEWGWIDKDPTTLGAKLRLENSLERARAAIKAMRAPTKTMLQKMRYEFAACHTDTRDECKEGVHVWDGGIAAALSEGER